MRRNIYLVGSLRNPEITRIARVLRDAGHSVYDDWISPGKEADDRWQEYERDRGRTFPEALKGHHARHVFENDKEHLDEADTVVMVAPCGRSAHLELGYFVGCGKPAYILLPGDPDRFDIMYRFATAVYFNLDDLVMELMKCDTRSRYDSANFLKKWTPFISRKARTTGWRTTLSRMFERPRSGASPLGSAR